jgi:outer membrane protein TolC
MRDQAITHPRLRCQAPALIIGLRRFTTTSAVLLLCACTTLGPDFAPPKAQLPAAWDHRATQQSQARAAYWWRLFNDPLLNQLVERAYQQNLSLEAAGLRIIQARAALGIADALIYPQQQTLSGAAVRTFSRDQTLNSIQLGFDVGWELDVWGKYARGIESSAAGLYASVASYDDILISITAEVARNYINWRTLQERLLLSEQNILIQQRVTDITQLQFDSGNVTELDVQQARTQLHSTQSAQPGLRTSIAQARNALAVLLGIIPDELEALLQSQEADQENSANIHHQITQRIEKSTAPGAAYQAYTIVPEAPTLHPNIAANLVQRRPDIRVAQLQAHAQSARIGLTQADLYPQFILFGNIGFNQNVVRGDAFTGRDAMRISIGPAFSWNIFNYGRIKNQVRVEDARFQESLTNFNQTVLLAVQEVSNALVAYENSQQQKQFTYLTVQSAIRAFSISLTQYQNGLVNYQRLLSTVEKMTVNEDRYAQAKGSVALQVVALYKALGGGWQIRSGKPFVSAEVRQTMRERSDWGDYLDTPPTRNSPAESTPP